MAGGSRSLDELILDFGKMPAEMRRLLLPGLRRAVRPMQGDMRSRAGWSTRIPGAIKLKIGLGKRNPGVRLTVDAAAAPHARPWEMGSGRNRNLRHPVFADPDEDRSAWTWAEEPVRPFFFPAVQSGRERLVAEVGEVIAATARAAGFR